jgi:hypothetical protein
LFPYRKRGLLELKRVLNEATASLRTFAEKWDVKYINDLPNAAFAVIEKGYSEGKDRRARHLPHHNKILIVQI